MSNDLTTNASPLDMINASLPTQENATVSNTEALALTASGTFLPTLSVAYGTSKVVTEGIASPGCFVLSGQTNLMKSIQVIAVAYRFKWSEWDNDKSEFGEDYIHFPKDGSIIGNASIDAFVKKPRSSGVKVSEGIEFLLYIPKSNVFVTFFAKGTLKGCVKPILDSGLTRLVQLTTRLEKGKGSNVFFPVDVLPLSSVLEGSKLDIAGVTLTQVPVAGDLLKKSWEIFHNKPARITDASAVKDVNN